jgi:hypothetical protein
MPITPDTKDWTWVLDRRCPECGFEAAATPSDQVASMVRDNAQQWTEILTAGGPLVQRPADDQWSAVEYACHVRDVFRIYLQRLHLMLVEDNPTFPNWDQDATALEDRYADQDPREIAVQLDRAASALADGFAGLTDQQWARTGARSDGANFTVDTFALYMIHDPIHHLHDVRLGLEHLGR